MNASVFSSSSFFIFLHFFNFIITSWGCRVTKTATWLSVAPARSASRPKAHEESEGGANKKGIFSKNLHLSCFCIKKQTWQETEIQYYGQAAHQMGVEFISVPPPLPPSIHPSLAPSLLPIHCHPSCLLPIQDVSHFSWLDSLIRNAQKNLASPCGQNTSFHLNYLIDFVTVYCFFLLLLRFFPFIFFPSGSLSAV